MPESLTYSQIKELEFVLDFYVKQAHSRSATKAQMQRLGYTSELHSILKEHDITKDSPTNLSHYIEAEDLELYFKDKIAELEKKLTSGKSLEDIVYTRATTPDSYQTDLVINLSDWHIGKIIDFEYNKFDMTVFDRRIKQVWDQILKHNPVGVRSVTLLFLGDMMESPLRNLRSSVKLEAIDQVSTAARYVFKTIKLVVDHFIESKIQVSFMSGNHDRGSRDKDEDYDRQPFQSMIDIVESNLSSSGILSLIELHRPLRRTAFLDINEHVVLIYFHGDACSKIENLCMSCRSQKHKLLIQGHLHYKYFMDKGLGYTHVIQPSLCGADAWEFDENSYIGSSAQSIITIQQDKLDITWLHLQ